MTAIRGDTFPVKDQIKAMGGRWNADQKCWMVPDDKVTDIQIMMATAPKDVRTPGTCSKCGKACKAPYTLCWDCKPAPTKCKQCGRSPKTSGYGAGWPRIYRNGICSDCYRNDSDD